MASYFDEHDCEPLDRERDPRTNMLLELASEIREEVDNLGRLWTDQGKRILEKAIWSVEDGVSGLESLFNRMDFEDLGLVVDWDHHLPPPAAKNAVENLPRTVIRGSQAELKCPVCLLEFEEEETAIEMPCHHLFHSNCILPWLSKTNSCPLCRHELPTDDDTYEEHKRDKAFGDGPRPVCTLCFRLASSSRSTASRTSTEPCTHEVARAGHWSSATCSSCILNSH